MPAEAANSPSHLDIVDTECVQRVVDLGARKRTKRFLAVSIT